MNILLSPSFSLAHISKHLILFDRDNTLVVDEGYVYKSEDLAWNAGALETLKFLSDLNITTGVISNQSGISKGIFDLNDSLNFFQTMNQTLSEKQIKTIDFYVLCPHEGIDECNCRKPKGLMLEIAMRICGVKKENTYFLGDKVSDREAAREAKIAFSYYNVNMLSGLKDFLNVYI
jgi:D-glycero-D-manno-heptose 1,7-bisphosphate phosphatase